jgi:hypothetical protein
MMMIRVHFIAVATRSRVVTFERSAHTPGNVRFAAFSGAKRTCRRLRRSVESAFRRAVGAAGDFNAVVRVDKVSAPIAAGSA